MNKFLILALLGLLLVSCDTDLQTGEFVVGSDYLGLTNKVVLVDTLTLEVSTINFDSLVTSNQSRILVGNYDDPVFGKVRSNSYFELGASDYKLYSNTSDTDVPNYVYDSIALILRYDKYHYGDTTNVQLLSVHRLLNHITPNVDDTNFYNNTAVSYATESLGSISYKPRPAYKDSVNITLSSAFGNDLFQKIKNNQLTNYNEFTDYLKGIMVKTDGGNTSNIIGFKTTSVLRLYYSKAQNPDEVSLIKDFSLVDLTRQFNNITLDRTGTILQNLPLSSSSLPSSQTNNTALIQSGTGMACRIDFPYIKKLRNLATNGAIVDAQLLIRPVKNTYSDAYPLKDSLVAYVSDHLNRISGTLSNSANETLYAVLNSTNDEFNENLGYSIGIGNFLQKELVKEGAPSSSLIFAFPNISKGVDRIIVGDQKNAANKIKLKIYYISY